MQLDNLLSSGSSSSSCLFPSYFIPALLLNFPWLDASGEHWVLSHKGSQNTLHVVKAFKHTYAHSSSQNGLLVCRFVILLSDDKDYFFILYLVYVGINVLLAGVALLHWPGSEQLQLINDPEGYQVCLLVLFA